MAALLVVAIPFLVAPETAQAACNDVGISGAKWCNRPTVFYHFGPGLNGSCAPTSECFKWRTAIRNAAAEWNQVTIFFENSFVLQEGDFSNTQLPGGILFLFSEELDLGFQDANCQQTPPPVEPHVCNDVITSSTAFGAYASLLVSAPSGSATMSTIVSACVHINPFWQWGQVDRESVARHEIAHCLGVNHAYGGDCLMQEDIARCGIVRNIDASAENPLTCIYGDLFGSCPGPMWGIHTAVNLATTPPSLQVVMATCDCSGGGCIAGAAGAAGSAAVPSLVRTYELAISESGGPYSVFATLQDADWVDRKYTHTFGEPHESARIRMRVFDGATQVAETFSLYPVYLPATATAVGELRDLRTLMVRGFPNPFMDETRVSFTLAAGADVDVSVYDVAGRRIARLHSGHLGAGRHTVRWDGRREDGSRTAPGAYRVVASTESGSDSGPIVLVGSR